MNSDSSQEISTLNHALTTSQIDFYTYRSAITGISIGLQDLINFRGELYFLVDNWFEIIEYCYFENKWNSLAIEVGEFLKTGIAIFPKELFLPKNSVVVNTHQDTLIKIGHSVG